MREEGVLPPDFDVADEDARASEDAAPWWRGYFDEAWLALHEDLFPEAESRLEVGAIRELLGLAHAERVLDLPCGWGRHTAIFPEAGLETYGADLSPALLARARAELTAHGAPVRLAACDMRALPFADGSFDAVVNVFTSLGLFLEDEEDLRALAEMRRVLVPGGRLLLESMHRDDLVAAYAARDAWALPDGTEVRVRRRFDPVTGISYERLVWRRGEERGEKRHALRLRTATEIRDLVLSAGFRDLAFYGDWDGSRVRRRSPRVVVTGRT